MGFRVPKGEMLGLTQEYVENDRGYFLKHFFLFKMLLLNIKDFKHFIRELFVTTTMNSSYGTFCMSTGF